MSDLSVVISADTSGLKKNIEESKQILEKYKGTLGKVERDTKGLSDSQVQAYQRVVNALKKVESGSMSLTQQEKALKTQITELRAQYSNLSQEARNSDFGKALAESAKTAKSQLSQLQMQMKELGANTEKAKGKTKDFSTNMDGLASVSKKCFAALAAGTAVFEGLKGVITATEGGIDELGRTTAAMDSAWNVFLNTINNGNWSNFFTNLINATKGARDLYDALDRLGSIKSNNAAAIAIKENALNELRVKKQNGENVDSEIQKIEAEIKALKNQSVEQGMFAGRKQMIQAIKEQNGNVSDADAARMADEVLNKGQAAFDNAETEIARLKAKAGTKTKQVYMGTTTYGAPMYSTQTVLALENLTKKEQDLLRAYQTLIDAETKVQAGISTYATAVNEGAANARQEYKVNGWTGNSGGGNTPNDIGKKIAEAMVKEASQDLDFWKLANSGIDARKSRMPLSMTYEPLNIGEDEDEIEANYQNQKVIEQYNKLLDERKRKEIETKANIEGISTAMSNLSNVMSSIGGDNPFSAIMQGAATALPQVMNLVSALSALSVAKGTSSASNWIEMIAAATAVAATIASTINSVKSSAKKYANGGIVEGTTTLGDNNWIRVNGGEMMLNQRQQASLFNQINQGGRINNDRNLSDVKFRIEGKDLAAILNTHNRRIGKVL